MNSASPTTYDQMSRINHWIVALAMIGMLGLGLYLANLVSDKETKGYLLSIHKSVGVLVLLYGTWRVVWRLRQGFPSPVASFPAWQERVSKLSHYGLLLCIVFMPFSGLMASLFADRAVDVFGLFTIPAIGDVKLIKSGFFTLHRLAGYGMVALIALHVAAALKHHFVDRDRTLVRMLRATPPSSIG